MQEEIIYFSINNWFMGRDYPKSDKFVEWVELNQFSIDKWCKENKICVHKSTIDMSFNWCVTAPRKWVEINCPELLTDDEYSYKIITCSSEGEVETEYYAKFSDFVYYPKNGNAPLHDRFCIPFLEYKEENFGSTFYEYPEIEDDEEEDDYENATDDWTVPQQECCSCQEKCEEKDEDSPINYPSEDEQKEDFKNNLSFFHEVVHFFKRFFCVCMHKN